MTYLNVVEVETATINLAAAYPSLTQLITLPNTTVEGRTSHAIRLGAGAPGSREVVMIICGVHAREWGSCEIAINFATDLLDAYSTNAGLAYGGKNFTAAQIQTLLNTLHIVVFPAVNPDGRHYSQTTDANWRKNGRTATPLTRPIPVVSASISIATMTFCSTSPPHSRLAPAYPSAPTRATFRSIMGRRRSRRPRPATYSSCSIRSRARDGSSTYTPSPRTCSTTGATIRIRLPIRR